MCHTQKERQRGAYLSDSVRWAGRWTQHITVCDAWLVRRRTYSYLSRLHRYQFILACNRGTCLWTTCPGLHPKARRPGVEPATWWLQVQRHNHSATEPHESGSTLISMFDDFQLPDYEPFRADSRTSCRCNRPWEWVRIILYCFFLFISFRCFYTHTHTYSISSVPITGRPWAHYK